MSRAFVKEPDGDQVQDDQPELPISRHSNYVTACGLQQLKDKHAGLLKKKRELGKDEGKMFHKTALAQIERELRYFNARINSAILVNPNMQDKDVVAIGATVKVVDENKKVLIGKKKGDKVVWRRPIGDLYVRIDNILYG